MTQFSSDVMNSALCSARDLFCKRDLFLIAHDAHERSMTFKFGAYLQEALLEYGVDVDCEYNRVGNEGAVYKRLPKHFFEPLADEGATKTIFPDIIVHRRGEARANYFVIEAKKAGNDQGIDELKLAVIASDVGYRYDHAILLTFSPRVPYVHWHELSSERIRELLAPRNA